MLQPNIANLNDQARQHWFDPKSVTVLLTRGIQALCLTMEERTQLLEKVAAFDDFGPDNDPWQEHDFGAFTHRGERIFWKIDYYDPSMTRHADDKVTARRVMTVMLASEY